MKKLIIISILISLSGCSIDRIQKGRHWIDDEVSYNEFEALLKEKEVLKKLSNFENALSFANKIDEDSCVNILSQYTLGSFNLTNDVFDFVLVKQFNFFENNLYSWYVVADVEELNSELTESQDSSKIAIRIRVDSLTKIAKIESIKEMNSTTFNNEFVLESLCFPIYRNFIPSRMDESGNLVSCERRKYLLFLAKQKKKNKNFFLLLFRFVDHPADSGDLLLEKIASMKKNGKISNFQDLKEVYGAYPLYHGK